MNLIPANATFKDPFDPSNKTITCEVLSWNTEEKTLFVIYTDGFSRFKLHFNDVIEFTFPTCVNEIA
jgi:hypothetical protein